MSNFFLLLFYYLRLYWQRDWGRRRAEIHSATEMRANIIKSRKIVFGARLHKRKETFLRKLYKQISRIPLDSKTTKFSCTKNFHHLHSSLRACKHWQSHFVNISEMMAEEWNFMEIIVSQARNGIWNQNKGLRVRLSKQQIKMLSGKISLTSIIAWQNRLNDLTFSMSTRSFWSAAKTSPGNILEIFGISTNPPVAAYTISFSFLSPRTMKVKYKR